MMDRVFTIHLRQTEHLSGKTAILCEEKKFRFEKKFKIERKYVKIRSCKVWAEIVG